MTTPSSKAESQNLSTNETEQTAKEQAERTVEKNKRRRFREWAADPTAAPVVRLAILGFFGFVIPLAFSLAFQLVHVDLTVNGKPIDLTSTFIWIFTPLDLIFAFIGVVAAISAEVLYELFRTRTELSDRIEAMGTSQNEWNREHSRLLQVGWVPASGFDRKLIDLRKAFDTIRGRARAKPDLFQRYFHRRIGAVRRQMTIAAEANRLEVNQLHFQSTEALMECLQGKKRDKDDFFWAVHFLDTETRDFYLKQAHAQDYAMAIFERVGAKQIREVHRLFVVDEDNQVEQLRDGFARRYIAFHTKQDGYDYKIVGKKLYESYLNNEQEEDLAKDFGIYGNLYVYETETANTKVVEGRFTRDKARIETYQDLFKHCWERQGQPYDKWCTVELPNVDSLEEVFQPNDGERPGVGLTEFPDEQPTEDCGPTDGPDPGGVADGGESAQTMRVADIPPPANPPSTDGAPAPAPVDSSNGGGSDE